VVRVGTDMAGVARWVILVSRWYRVVMLCGNRVVSRPLSSSCGALIVSFMLGVHFRAVHRQTPRMPLFPS
jgi:hypothetical protein